MPLPPIQKTYDLSPCNRLIFSSLVQVQREFMFGVKQHLLSVGYTVKGSSDGTTGGMDAVDRWDTAAKAGVRAANTTTAVSWIVLVSALGTNILLSYVGASDDIYRISVSHQGDYAAAGTPTHTPTSANEQIIVNTSTINNTASGDRLWTCLARTDAKGFRVAIARGGVWVGSVWGCEEYTKAAYGAGITTSDEHGWSFQVAQLGGTTFPQFVAQTRGSYVRTSLAPNLAGCAWGCEAYGGAGVAIASDQGQGFAPELQGGSEFMLKRVGIFSVTAAMRGKVGNVIDWWVGRTAGMADGDHYGNKEFIQLGGLVWPWDGTPSVVGSDITMT